MTPDEEEDLIEDLGMQRGTCPKCGATVYTDTGFFRCDNCGTDEEDDEIERRAIEDSQ